MIVTRMLLLLTGLLIVVNSFITEKIPCQNAPRSAAQAVSAPFVTDDQTMPLSVGNATCTLANKALIRSKRQELLFWKKKSYKTVTYQFDYKYNKVELSTNNNINSNKTTAILLIHPIGVGIDSWFYNRLLQALYKKRSEMKNDARRVVVLAPDLLACGSASNPIVVVDDSEQEAIQKLPLFNVTDWSSQMQQFMASYEQEQSHVDINWCIVSNGGCVPIALDIAQDYCHSKQVFSGNLTHVILSAPPSLKGLLQYPPPASKIQKNYKTLSGIVGKVFWWYALRRNGAFIQKFSEKNLAANPKNLGKEWTPTCVHTATTYPLSKYSTFMFLAGALQQSCTLAFNAIQRNGSVRVDVILGGDKRTNPAKR